MFIGLVARTIYWGLGFEDYWGDSYHNLIIVEKTIQNDWVYDDYKNRQVVWLPTYRYLVGFFMNLVNDNSLNTAKILNICLSLLSIFLTFRLTQITTKSSQKAFFSALVLSLLPWHAAFSIYNMSENLCGLLIIGVIYILIRERYLYLFPLTFLGVLCRNEVTFIYFIIWWL